MPVVELSQGLILSLKVISSSTRTEWCDSVVKGLYLLVSQTGTRSFFWRTKVDGKTTHFPVGHTSEITLAAARDQVLRWKSGVESPLEKSTSPVVKAKEDMTLSDLWSEYEDFAKTTVPRSAKRLEQLWRIRILPRMGHLKLRAISLRQIQTFMMDLRKEGLSAATADYHGALLRRMGNMAVKWGYLETNFAKGVQLYHEFNGIENVLSDDQLSKLLEVLRTDGNRPICLIALYLLSTGARMNEALSAQWKNVSIENKIWLVPKESSKSKRLRSIPLNESALEVLKQIDRKESDLYVFTNRKTGTRYVNVFKPWNRIRNKAGVPFLRCHDLRHMYASYAVNNGRSIYEVSQLLGHADTRTTARYAHLSSNTLMEAANSVSAKLSAVTRLKSDTAEVQLAA